MILTIAIGISTGCVYALVAVGYSLIYRTTAVVNFAQGSYVMIGGLATYWFFRVLNLPYPLAIGLATATASIAGLILWSCVVLPLWRRGSQAYVVLLETIIFGAILSTAAVLIVGPMPQTLPDWIPGLSWTLGDSHLDGQYLVIIGVTAVLMTSVSLTLQFTVFGRAMRACAASRETSALIGISPERIGAISFAATAALGGFAGAVITPAQFTSADSGLEYGIFGFVAAVLGGFGSMPGAMIGGLLLGLVNVFVGRYVSSNYQTVIAFSLLLTLLAVRPSGLLGKEWDKS